MINAVHDDRSEIFVDLVHDAICTATRRSKSGQLTMEHTTEAMGIFKQWSDNELHHCRSNFRRKLRELPLGGGGDPQLIAVRVSHVRRYFAFSASAPT